MSLKKQHNGLKMKYRVTLLLLSLSVINARAQQLQGRYTLRGIQDMTAGFEFKADSFRYFYFYGAASRFAEGTYSVSGDTIRLKSTKTPGKDFTVVKKTSGSDGNYTIQVNENNSLLKQYVTCIVREGANLYEYQSSSSGVIKFSAGKKAKIYLKHQWYPDIPTLIKTESDSFTSFEVTLNPSLEWVSFQGIDLIIVDANTLSWLPNYLMPEDKVQFVKNSVADDELL